MHSGPSGHGCTSKPMRKPALCSQPGPSSSSATVVHTCTAWPVGEGTPVEPGRPPSARPTRLELLHRRRGQGREADTREDASEHTARHNMRARRLQGQRTSRSVNMAACSPPHACTIPAPPRSLGHARGLGSRCRPRRRRVVVLDIPEAALGRCARAGTRRGQAGCHRQGLRRPQAGAASSRSPVNQPIQQPPPALDQSPNSPSHSRPECRGPLPSPPCAWPSPAAPPR